MPIHFDDPVTSVLDEALFYESLGWSVIPISTRSKMPTVSWEIFQTEKADATQIHKWFDQSTLNLGIITGDISGRIVVIDIDKKPAFDGDDTLAELCMKHGDTLPDTVEAFTGGGGRHLYFRYPPGVIVRNSQGGTTEGLGPAIDVRASGGYVIAPPSMHNETSRRYVWSVDNGPHDITVTDCPSWLLELIREKPEIASRQINPIRKVVDNTGEFDAFGERIDLREKRATELTMAIFYGLQKSLNRVPTVEEIYTDVANTYYSETKGSKIELEAQHRGDTMLWAKAEYILKRHHRGSLPEPNLLNSQEKTKSQPDLEDDTAEPEPRSRPIGELSGEPEPRKWAVDSLVPAYEVTSLYGDGGVGKSLLAQQLATSVALGKEFLRYETMQAPSLYISCEDDYAELQRRQYSINNNNDVVFGSIINGRLWSRVGYDNIMVAWPITGRAIVAPFVEKVIAEIELYSIKLLVLDNISDLFGGNENDRSQVNYFAKAVLGQIIQRCGVTIVLLGHPPKNPDADYSGSTAWNAAVRARHQLRRPPDGMDDERQLVCRKSNYSDSTDLKIDLIWQEGVFVVPELGDNDTVARIVYQNTVKALLSKVSEAWIEGRPYSARRDHPRSLDRLMMDSVGSREDRDAMRRALHDAKKDEWIETGRTGQKRGYRIAMPPKWAI